MVDKLTRPYVPGLIGSQEVDLAAMGQELGNIERAISNLHARSPVGAALLQGQPDDFVVDGVPKPLVNYGAPALLGEFDGGVDDAAGIIRVNRPEWVRVTAHAVGEQGNNSFNEAAQLLLDDGGRQIVFAVYEIPNNKTATRAWNASTFYRLPRELNEFRLLLTATSGLGTFSFTQASFQVEVYDLPLTQEV